MKKYLASLAILFCAAVLVPAACADQFQVYGPPAHNQFVAGAGLQMTSDNAIPGDYAGMEYQITSGLTVNDLTNLSADYTWQQGTFAGGSPRFTLFDQSFHAAYVYWGTPGGGCSMGGVPPVNTPATTGNYVGDAGLRVASNGFGGDNNPNTCVSWSSFASLVGGTQLSFITLDLDAGFAGTQQMTLQSFTVNNDTFDAVAASVPEPGSLALFGSGLLGLAGTIRRRRRK